MTKEDIFNYFYTNSANLGIKETVLVLVGSLFVALIIYLTYWTTYKGVSYNNKFNISLVIIEMISTVLMVMISSNIVISLGMVGALSIVRFRTAIKDAKDSVFIFWAITEGLCVGSLNFKLAVIAVLFIAVILMLFNYIPKVFNKYLLVISGEKVTIDTIELMNIVKDYTIDCKLRTANRNDSNQEMIYEIKTRGELNIDIIKELLNVDGITAVNYVSESSETIG